MNKKQQFHAWYLVAALAVILLFQGWWTTYKTVEPLEYSEFLDHLKKGEITDVSVSQDTISITQGALPRAVQPNRPAGTGHSTEKSSSSAIAAC